MLKGLIQILIPRSINDPFLYLQAPSLTMRLIDYKNWILRINFYFSSRIYIRKLPLGAQ